MSRTTVSTVHLYPSEQQHRFDRLRIQEPEHVSQYERHNNATWYDFWWNIFGTSITEVLT